MNVVNRQKNDHSQSVNHDPDQLGRDLKSVLNLTLPIDEDCGSIAVDMVASQDQIQKATANIFTSNNFSGKFDQKTELKSSVKSYSSLQLK